MHPTIKIVCINFVVFMFLVTWVNGFRLDGKPMDCAGHRMESDSRLKKQFQNCNQTVFDRFKQAGIKPTGYGPILCVALCGFMEDKLIDEKSGKLVPDGLKIYDSFFDSLPNNLKNPLKKTFHDCFKQQEDTVVYNKEDLNDCSGFIGVGYCLKQGIDKICVSKKGNEDSDEE